MKAKLTDRFIRTRKRLASGRLIITDTIRSGLDQAKSRIEAKAYSSVSELQKDANGNWRGKAMKDGVPVNVILDVQGNIVAN